MCGCNENKIQQDIGVIERLAKRQAIAKAENEGKTIIYVVYLCAAGNPDFMLEDDWSRLDQETMAKYTFVKYVSSI